MYPSSLSLNLRKLSQRLNRLIETKKFHRLSYKKRQQWIHRIQRLKQHLTKYQQNNQIRKTITGATIVLSLAIGNTVEAQSFYTPELSPFGLTNNNEIHFTAGADMDNDGDFDLITGGFSVGAVGFLRYFENTGDSSMASFTLDSINSPVGSISTNYFSIPILVDIDADGDQDLFVSEYTGVLNYYENIGTPTSPIFSAAQTPFGLNLILPGVIFIDMKFADIDNDGDFDVFAGSYYSAVTYFENTGDSANAVFGTPVQNPFGIVPPAYSGFPELTDIDLDGDLDLFIQGAYYGPMYYYENTGDSTQPAFGVSVQTPFNLTPNNLTPGTLDPLFLDIDADGDVDYFATPYNSNMDVVFQENLMFSNNIIPTSADTSIVLNEGDVFNFDISNFPFSDADSTDNLEKIRITGLATNGALFVSGNAVSINQEIDAIDISSMSYNPQSTQFMANYGVFTFQVSDGRHFSDTSYVMTININGLPTTIQTTVETIQDTDYLFDIADFTFNDLDGGTFEEIQIITLPTKGVVKYNGTSIIAGDIIATSDFANLVYSPGVGQTGFPHTHFQFRVGDGIGFSQPVTLFVRVDFPISTNEINEKISFEITPNPSSDFVNIQIQTVSNQSARLTIQNLTGQIVLNEKIELNGDFNTSIDVSNWTKGVYVVHVKTENGIVWTEKIIVE